MTHGKDNGGSKQADCCQFKASSSREETCTFKQDDARNGEGDGKANMIKAASKTLSKVYRWQQEAVRKDDTVSQVNLRPSSKKDQCDKVNSCDHWQQPICIDSSVDIVLKASIFVQFDNANSAKKPSNLTETLLKEEAKLLLAL